MARWVGDKLTGLLGKFKGTCTYCGDENVMVKSVIFDCTDGHACKHCLAIPENPINYEKRRAYADFKHAQQRYTEYKYKMKKELKRLKW